LIAAVVAVASGCASPEGEPQAPEVRVVEAGQLPLGCDPDRIVTITADCSADPFVLDPVYSGQTVWFKNGMRTPITVNVQQGLFTDTKIDIPGAGGACRDVLEQTDDRYYWYWVEGAGCPDPPPEPEARPRIVVKISRGGSSGE
jgi:hypothetical protein